MTQDKREKKWNSLGANKIVQLQEDNKIVKLQEENVINFIFIYKKKFEKTHKE